MKKIVFLVFCLCLLTSCAKVKTLICEHNFQVETKKATCTEDGLITKTCINCQKVEKVPLEKLEHQFEYTKIDPTCTAFGQSEGVCKNCNYKTTVVLEKLPHSYTPYEVVIKATDLLDGLEKRTCTKCGTEDEKIIPSIAYIDLDTIKFAFDKTKTYDVKTIDEMQILYNSALLNDVETLNLNLLFEVESLNELLENLKNNCSIHKTYELSAQLSGKTLTISFTYKASPLYLASTTDRFVQLFSLNSFLSKTYTTRSEDFDDFKINTSLYTYEVETSEQLVYCLERRVCPIPKKGSAADIIFQEAKNILRQIISDDMTTLEKIKQIHDYLIMNITYDQSLYDLLYQNSPNIHSYRGFYLEGAILDKRAVCEGISKAFVLLANIEGIPCVMVEGYQTTNPNGAGHAWNKINVDGEWYIIDATSDGVILGDKNEILSYEYFLIDEATMKKKYTGTTFVNIVCDKKIDYFKTFFITYDEKSFDLYAETFDELKELIDFAYKNMMLRSSINQFTLQFKLDYAKDILSEVQKALTSQGISISFSYVTNDNLFTIIM